MQPFVTDAPADFINAKDLRSRIQTLVTEKSVESLLGSLGVSQGILLVFHSPRFNSDFQICVKTADTEAVMNTVREILGLGQPC